MQGASSCYNAQIGSQRIVLSIICVKLVAATTTCAHPPVVDATGCCCPLAASAPAAGAAALLQLLKQLKREPVLPSLDLAGVAHLIQRCAEDPDLSLLLWQASSGAYC
jgi:hypothetical protein